LSPIARLTETAENFLDGLLRCGGKGWKLEMRLDGACPTGR
jgi:hypothetical protein